MNPLELCKHRWTAGKPIYFDRKHWIIVRRCRKCDLAEQIEYEVVERNGKLETLASVTPVTITKVANS